MLNSPKALTDIHVPTNLASSSQLQSEADGTELTIGPSLLPLIPNCISCTSLGLN